MQQKLILFLIAICPTISLKSYGQEIWGITTKGGSQNSGVLFRTGSDGTNPVVVKDFAYDTPGMAPNAPLVQCANGKLYGTSTKDGASGVGILFEYSIDTKKFVKKLDFQGASNGSTPTMLVHATNDKLYGITNAGGSFGFGVLYEYDPAADAFTKLYEFQKLSTGIGPRCLLQAANGKLYGTAAGGTLSTIIFEYNLTTNTYKIVCNTSSNLSLMKEASTGYLYGIASNTVVRFNVSTGVFNSLAGLLDNAAGNITEGANGKLYGFTSDGGANLFGYIYEYDPAANTVKIKFALNPPTTGTATTGLPYNNFVLAPNGKLYAPLVSQLAEYDPATNTYVKKAGLGSAIWEPLVATDGKLYGITQGGAASNGSIYVCDIANNTVTTLVNFHYFQDGALPKSGLMRASNGKVYGIASSGGIGTLFEYDLSLDTFRTVYNFSKVSYAPNPGTLVEGPDGRLYGVTTSVGGTNNVGAVFAYTISSQIISHRDFSQTLTGYGATDLMLASDQNFYGINPRGSGGTLGFIFKYDVIAGTVTGVYSFPQPTYSAPVGVLVQGANGHLYGFTTGGSTSDGLIFEYNMTTATMLSTTGFTAATTGKAPTGYSVIAPNGKLYGTTTAGGANSKGVLFEFDFSTNTLSKKFDFDATTFGIPSGKLTLAGNGNIYGMTSVGGTNNLGVLFEYNPTTGVCAKKFDFDGTNGSSPNTCGLVYLNDISHETMTDQSITFDPLAAKTFGDAAFDLSATASSGLNVTFSSSDASIASVNNATVTIHQAGQVTITATQSGNTSYNAAPHVQQTLTINKATQTIQLASIPDKTLGDADFAIQATASSGLSATYTTTSDKIVLTDNTVTLVKAGSVTIAAKQSGNENFEAAADATRSFCINPKPAHITSSLSSDDVIAIVSDATAGNQWYLNGAPISGATSATLVTTHQGSYTVKVSVDNCTSAASNQIDFVIAGVAEASVKSISLFPNPVTDIVTVSFGNIAGVKQVSILQVNGATLESASFSGQQGTINVSRHAPGAYLLRINTKDQTRTMTFVKK